MTLTEIKSFLRLALSNSIRSVLPGNLIRNELVRKDNFLTVRSKTYELRKNCYVVGFGKAALDMGRETESILRGHICKGILSVPKGIDTNMEGVNFQVYEGAENNIPDEGAMKAAIAIVELVKSLKESDLLIVLISGGGSALLPYPIPPMSLDDKITVTRMLGKAGAGIKELNSVRKRLSGVKGGKLAAMSSATVLTLILSDVVGDPISYIASGPTVPDEDNLSPEDVLKKYGLLNKIPLEVKHLLNQDPIDRKLFERVDNFVIGNNRMALLAAQDCATSMGYHTLVVTTCLEGNVSKIAQKYLELSLVLCKVLNKEINRTLLIDFLEELSQDLALSALHRIASEVSDMDDKLCLLFGGETTAIVTGGGRGGRNQELALKFSHLLEGLSPPEFSIALLCAGTDGIDGPTDAAGAIAHSGQMENAHQQGIDAQQYIQNNDSYNFYSNLSNGEDQIKIGHTGTNVMDIHILIIQKNN